MEEKKSERIAFRVSPSLKKKFEAAGDKYAKSAGALFEFLAEAVVNAEESEMDISWPPKLVTAYQNDDKKHLQLVAEDSQQYGIPDADQKSHKNAG